MAKASRIEAAFEQLEAIIAALEEGELPLEQALKRYEEGLALVRQARGQLDAYAARIEELREGEDADGEA